MTLRYGLLEEACARLFRWGEGTMKKALIAFVSICAVLSGTPPMPGGPTQGTGTVTIRYVDEFGKPWAGCRVREFSFSQNETHLDFAGRFDGMVGQDIPLSADYYEVRLACPGALVDGPFYVSVMNPHASVLLSAWNHRGDYQTGLGPRLTVHVSVQPPEALDQAWVKITGVYLDRHEVAGVDPDSGDARMFDIVPGTYVVLLLNGRKIDCVNTIEFLKPGARLQLAVSPRGCEATGSSSVSVLK